MASHYVPCDDALDRIGHQHNPGAPSPFDAEPSDQAWKVVRGRLLALPDWKLLDLAENGSSEAARKFEAWAARQIRQALREGTKDTDLSDLIDALYDSGEEDMAAEDRRQDSDGWLA